MSETKHTPGPWEFDTDWNIVAKDGRGTVVIASLNINEEFVTDPSLAEQGANGTLLARAPRLAAEHAEMREALRFLLSALDDTGLSSWPGDSGKDVVYGADTARAVLAKVEGE